MDTIEVSPFLTRLPPRTLFKYLNGSPILVQSIPEMMHAKSMRNQLLTGFTPRDARKRINKYKVDQLLQNTVDDIVQNTMNQLEIEQMIKDTVNEIEQNTIDESESRNPRRIKKRYFSRRVVKKKTQRTNLPKVKDLPLPKVKDLPLGTRRKNKKNNRFYKVVKTKNGKKSWQIIKQKK